MSKARGVPLSAGQRKLLAELAGKSRRWLSKAVIQTDLKLSAVSSAGSTSQTPRLVYVVQSSFSTTPKGVRGSFDFLPLCRVAHSPEPRERGPSSRCRLIAGLRTTIKQARRETLEMCVDDLFPHGGDTKATF